MKAGSILPSFYLVLFSCWVVYRVHTLKAETGLTSIDQVMLIFIVYDGAWATFYMLDFKKMIRFVLFGWISSAGAGTTGRTAWRWNATTPSPSLSPKSSAPACASLTTRYRRLVTEFYRVSLCASLIFFWYLKLFTEFNWLLLGFTWFYLVSLK